MRNNELMFSYNSEYQIKTKDGINMHTTNEMKMEWKRLHHSVKMQRSDVYNAFVFHENEIFYSCNDVSWTVFHWSESIISRIIF